VNAVLEALFKAGKGVFRCFAFGAAMALNQSHIYSFMQHSLRFDGAPVGAYSVADSFSSRAWRRACACFCKM